MHNDRCVPLRDLIQPILPETDPKGLGVGTRPAASLFTWTSWLPDLPDFVRASAVTTAPLRVQRLRLLLFSLCRCVQRPVCAGSGVDGDTTSLRPLTQPSPSRPFLPPSPQCQPHPPFPTNAFPLNPPTPFFPPASFSVNASSTSSPSAIHSYLTPAPSPRILPRLNPPTTRSRQSHLLSPSCVVVAPQ